MFGIYGLSLPQAMVTPPEVEVDWQSCAAGIRRSTAASVLVAADPEWTPEGKLSATAISGVKQLAEAGARNIRLLDFNIFPIMSCAQGHYSLCPTLLSRGEQMSFCNCEEINFIEHL